MIKLYLDGSSIENPGLGGYSCFLQCERYSKKIFKGFRYTTNNRMELLSMIISLESLKRDNQLVFVYSDSKYVVDSVGKKWLFGWEKSNFKDKKNSDLWKRFLIVYRKHFINFQWIKGHNKHLQNERCDQLAVKAAKGGKLDKRYFL